MKSLKTLTIGLALFATLNVLNAQGEKLNSKNLIESSKRINGSRNLKPLYSKVAVETKEIKEVKEEMVVYTTSQAISFYKAGDYMSAIEALNQVVSGNNRDIYAMYYLALSYFKINHYDLSAETFEKLIFTDGTFSISYLYLSKIAFAKNEYDKALVNINDFNKQNPHNHEGMHLKGLILENQNKLKDAVLYMNNAIKVDKNESQYHFDIARVRIKLKSISRACEDLSTAFKLGKEEAKPLLGDYCIGKKEVIK